MSVQRAKGTRLERTVATYLAAALNDDRIERRALNGAKDRGAVFPEWMMGYPAGWVTDILRRNPAIKACGNGVVPQQAYAALTVLWARVLGWVVAA